MPDRLQRPPVRLRGGLPDGTQTGIPEETVKDLLGVEPDDFYALVRLGRRQLIHDDETEGDVAVVGTLAIETLEHGVFCPTCDTTAAEELVRLRSERLGENTLDFDNATDADTAKLADLRFELAEYAAVEGLDDTALAADVFATVPDAGVDWRADARILGEYLRVKGHIADPPAGSTAELASVPAGDE